MKSGSRANIGHDSSSVCANRTSLTTLHPSELPPVWGSVHRTEVSLRESATEPPRPSRRSLVASDSGDSRFQNWQELQLDWLQLSCFAPSCATLPRATLTSNGVLCVSIIQILTLLTLWTQVSCDHNDKVMHSSFLTACKSVVCFCLDPEPAKPTEKPKAPEKPKSGDGSSPWYSANIFQLHTQENFTETQKGSGGLKSCQTTRQKQVLINSKSVCSSITGGLILDLGDAVEPGKRLSRSLFHFFSFNKQQKKKTCWSSQDPLPIAQQQHICLWVTQVWQSKRALSQMWLRLLRTGRLAFQVVALVQASTTFY